MISRQVIDDIISRTDIQTLISPYVTLKRAGSNLNGLCPFHSEKSPSFTVYPNDNSFYCFGCGIGGNAITFVKKIENLDFEDAVEFLAKRVGIAVTRDNELQYEKRVDKNRFYQMNVEAARFFHHELYKNTPDAKNAYAYFSEKRHLSDATIKHFGLGYCPNEYGALSKYLLSKGYTEEELITAYLGGRSEKSRSLYDYFRGRVIFPIIDVSGNVIAFGGRVLDDSKPKYKNTSDTPIFKKSRNLFALNLARHTCQESLILCEGYMDVIALHAAGFSNAVATLGTAITAEQSRLMKRYTKTVIISYDTDAAGRAAADKATRLLEEAGLEVKLLKIPSEAGTKDPDEYIKKYGSDNFRSILEESRTKFNYYFERSLALHDINITQEKVKVISEMAALVASFFSAAERDVYAGIVAEKLGIDKKSFLSDITLRLNKANRASAAKERDKHIADLRGIGDKVNPDFAKQPSIARAEENILGMMILFENHRTRVFREKLISADDFYTEFGKKVFSYIEASEDEHLLAMDEHFSPEEVGRIVRMKQARMKLTDNGDSVFEENLEFLKKQMTEKTEKEEKLTIDNLEDFFQKIRKEENS